MTYSRSKTALAALILLAPMQACSQQRNASVIDGFCREYKPVCLSRKDTQPTIDAVMRNERAFVALCPDQAAVVKC